MSNLIQISNNVSRNLDDLSANFYDPILDIQPSIQDGYNLIVGLCETIETYTSTPVDFISEKVFYDLSVLIPGYLRVFGIFNNNTQRWMYPTTALELYSFRDNWELAAGDPFLFLPIDYKTVAFFPNMVTAAGNFTVLYKAKADTLLANSTPQLPQENVNVLEWYATDDLLDQAQEWYKALDYANMVDKGIDDIRKVLRNRSQPNHLYFNHGNIG